MLRNVWCTYGVFEFLVRHVTFVSSSLSLYSLFVDAECDTEKKEKADFARGPSCKSCDFFFLRTYMSRGCLSCPLSFFSPRGYLKTASAMNLPLILAEYASVDIQVPYTYSRFNHFSLITCTITY